MFAGATLAGCYTSTPDPQSPPPPDDHRHGHEVAVEAPPPPPPPPVDAGGFAQPPPDASTATQQPVASGSLFGRVTVGPNGRPHARGIVRLFAQGQKTRTTYTNADGEFVFEGVPEGVYELVVDQPRPNHPRQSPPPPVFKKVQIAAGVRAEVDVAVQPPTVRIDRGPCCKPYGAPPARRRVV